MEETFVAATKAVKLCIDTMALILLTVGTVQAFINAIRAMAGGSAEGPRVRQIWMQYSRWLVAGLTFQLAADIIESAIAPTWSDIGKLASIAVIRTFLNYFLDRDMESVRKRDQEELELRLGSGSEAGRPVAGPA